MNLEIINEYLWALVVLLASIWAGITAYDHRNSRRTRLISAAVCIALILSFLVRIYKLTSG